MKLNPSNCAIYKLKINSCRATITRLFGSCYFMIINMNNMFGSIETCWCLILIIGQCFSLQALLDCDFMYFGNHIQKSLLHVKILQSRSLHETQTFCLCQIPSFFFIDFPG
ncbi:LOW QUALITY PROTEIN: hypothetical protein PanWU01x14_140230 [Parasponia andersonii]|uniref:Uncharacterized protein n=1 Tax=Parasponia andersonii TaxID=3476 RepID=A0A2P5CMB6_PARAD|nr:LOW QUALITY PROTEIN: hypothetical protein PanWU01x14_140230 [Parasponia andersonii]